MKVSDSFQLDFFLFSLINLRMSSYFYLLFFYFYFNCVEGRCACAPLPGRTCGATPDNPNEAWCLEGATPVARCVSHEAQCGGCPHCMFGTRNPSDYFAGSRIEDRPCTSCTQASLTSMGSPQTTVSCAPSEHGPWGCHDNGGNNLEDSLK